MIRSAAKNHERVAVVVDPADYARAARRSSTRTTGEVVGRRCASQLARKAFAHTAAYDGAIADVPDVARRRRRRARRRRCAATFPETLTLQWRTARALRYGENPHQKAAFYARRGDAATGPSLARAEVLQGKELSYNNILDLDAALRLCARVRARRRSAIIKHNNPCGVAERDDGVAEAYRARASADPVSAFGGIVAVNRAVDDDARARAARETFLECVDRARLHRRRARGCSAQEEPAPARRAGRRTHGRRARWQLRAVAGGAAGADARRSASSSAAERARSRPSARRRAAELRATSTSPGASCKHVKSNAIVFARARAASAPSAIGAGQMSRVDSVRIARAKARAPLDGLGAAPPTRSSRSATASTRPPRRASTAVVQPGGSVRDDEVIAAADEHGMAMVFTGMRHFRH